jgi:hypothetical protein
MSEPATSGVVSALETVLKLWDRSLALLFTLFGICCTLLAAAVGARWLGGPDYISGSGVYLIVGAIVFGGLAIGRTIDRAIERKKASFHFIPDDAQSFWTTAKQANGDIHSQITLRLQATNLTKRSLKPAQAILKRPLLWGCRPIVMIATEAPTSELYSPYTTIPAGFTRNVALEFMIPKKIGKPGFPLDVKVVIEDQRGHRNTLIFKRVRWPA